MNPNSLLKDKNSIVIFYASYIPIFPVETTTQETERDRIKFLLDSGIEHIIVQSSISSIEDAPPPFAKRIITPKHKLFLAKSSISKIIDRIYFNLFLIKHAWDIRKRNRKAIIFFYGQDLIPVGNIIKTIFNIPYICYLGDSFLGVSYSEIGQINLKIKLLRMMEWFTRKADFIILFNNAEREGLTDKGFDQNVIKAIPFSKNNAYISHWDDKMIIPSNLVGKFIVSYHGNMEFKHNRDGAITIIEKIAPELLKYNQNKIVLVIIGDSFIGIEKSGNVVTFPFTSDKKKLMDILSLSSLYIVPINTSTGIKGKILDAMSLGIPVIATPHIASQLIDEDSPVIVKEIPQMAEAIMEIYKMPADELQKIREITLKYFNSNYTSKVYERYLDLFEELV